MHPVSDARRPSSRLDCLEILRPSLWDRHDPAAARPTSSRRPADGSFSAAAEALHLAQPTLSEQIRRLEAELGRRAVRPRRPAARADRGRPRVRCPHAEAALAAAEEAAGSPSASLRELTGGTASFGTFGSAHRYLHADLVQDFRAPPPGCASGSSARTPPRSPTPCATGDLEAGLIALPIDDRGLDVRPSMQRRDPLRQRRARAPRHAGDDRATSPPAPLILYRRALRARGPDAPPALRARPARGRARSSRRSTSRTSRPRSTSPRAAWATRSSRAASCSSLGAARARAAAAGSPFAEPLYDTFAFINRRGARLSPAAREFMALAEERMQAMAGELRTTPPRRHRPAAEPRPVRSGRCRTTTPPSPRGVPADPLLAVRGRAADDRRQHRPRDAALAADGARDGRPPRARRLHHARRRQGDLVHRRRAASTPRRSSAATA